METAEGCLQKVLFILKFQSSFKWGVILLSEQHIHFLEQPFCTPKKRQAFGNVIHGTYNS